MSSTSDSDGKNTAAGSSGLGRVAWVTGASSGIGRAVAVRLARRGMLVAASARSADELEALARETPGIRAFPLDITDRSGVQAAVAEIEGVLGPIDLALFCAATWKVMDVEDLDADPMRRGMDVNFGGTVETLVPVAKRMMQRSRGRIAIVASVAGYRGLPRSAAYAPTKAALINLAECLEPDLARHNVAITIVNPGFVDTPMTRNNDFPMPFLTTVDVAAERIVAGLSKGHYEIAFPWQLVAILKFLRVLPNRLFLWLIRRNVARAPKT